MNASKQPSRMGRPPRFPEEGPRIGHSLRLKPSIDSALREAAAKNNRSLAEEMEHRINASFESVPTSSSDDSAALVERIKRAESELEVVHLQRQADYSRAKISIASTLIFALNMRRVNSEFRVGLLERLSAYLRAKVGVPVQAEVESAHVEMDDLEDQIEQAELEYQASKEELAYIRAKQLDLYKLNPSFRKFINENSNLDAAFSMFLRRIRG